MAEEHESLLPSKEGPEAPKGAVYVARMMVDRRELVEARLVGGPEGVFATWSEGIPSAWPGATTGAGKNARSITAGGCRR